MSEQERMRKLLGLPPLRNLRGRSQVLAEVRRFFDEQNYVEIEAPVLVPASGMEIHIQALSTPVRVSSAATRTYWLHTSPEYALKKLMASGAERVFSITKVFRDGESTERHNVEFTMLEWYQAGLSFDGLITQTQSLVQRVSSALASARLPGDSVPFSSFKHVDLIDAFSSLGISFANIPEHDTAAFARAANAIGVRTATDDGFDDIFNRVMLERIEQDVREPTFFFHYPIELAALARRSQAQPRAAERMELFHPFAGSPLEICNGYGELTDAHEQRRRFEAEQTARRLLGRDVYAIDEALLTSMSSMPAMSGNALGLDRLTMLALGCEHIGEVLSAPVIA